MATKPSGMRVTIIIHLMLATLLDPGAKHAGISAAWVDGKWRSLKWKEWRILDIGTSLVHFPRT